MSKSRLCLLANLILSFNISAGGDLEEIRKNSAVLYLQPVEQFFDDEMARGFLKTERPSLKAADLTVNDKKIIADLFSILLECHQEECETIQQLVNILDLYVVQLKEIEISV